mmetsp:Transcript_3084/g.10551  ORF Transcript_3084/g.10551 Transcript_3084/m.10551 type:complete len:248 (-) Transcript_3084:489-1232(-)
MRRRCATPSSRNHAQGCRDDALGALRLGESVHVRSVEIGRIVSIVSFSDLDAAAKRAVPSAQKRADIDDDFVFVELYATGKSQPGPARLELTRRQVVVPVCALEAIVLVVHADHDVSLPLEGVIGLVYGKSVGAISWPSVPEGSLTHLALGLRVELHAVGFGILSEGGSDKKNGIGCSAATIGMTNTDFAILSRLFNATGAPPTARPSTTGKISWAMRPSDVTFVKRTGSSSTTTLSFVTRAQLAGV